MTCMSPQMWLSVGRQALRPHTLGGYQPHIELHLTELPVPNIPHIGMSGKRPASDDRAQVRPIGTLTEPAAEQNSVNVAHGAAANLSYISTWMLDCMAGGGRVRRTPLRSCQASRNERIAAWARSPRGADVRVFPSRPRGQIGSTGGFGTRGLGFELFLDATGLDRQRIETM
jgi:hypothetical protein